MADLLLLSQMAMNEIDHTNISTHQATTTLNHHTHLGNTPTWAYTDS